MIPENEEQFEGTKGTYESSSDRLVGRRMFVAGAAGAGFASLLGLSVAFAQDSTGDAEDDLDDTTDDLDEADDVDDGDDIAEADQAGETYQNFLTKLTANLGMTDTTTVDLAVRDSLKAIVDEKLAEGSISQNDADALKERIDSGASPLGVAGIAAARGRGRSRRRERRKDAEEAGGIGGTGDDPGTGSETPTAEATPTT